ncbi:MAG: hypothetical protein ACRESZ_02920 [Methylococcales bacterium]
MNNDAPGLRLIYTGWIQFAIDLFILFALFLVVLTLGILYYKKTIRSKYILLVAWGILPPVWFVIEYFFIFLPYGNQGAFVFFQYGQDIASKLWAAVFALISIDLYNAINQNNNSEHE